MSDAPDTPAPPVASASPASPAPPTPRRRPWLTVLLCSVIFLAGGVVGGGLTGLVLVERAQRALRHPEEMPLRISRHLSRRLDLDDAQTRQVEQILDRRLDAVVEARAAALMRAVPELDGMGQEIEAVLRPPQIERWRRHFRTLREEWLPPPPPRRPGRPGY